MSGGLNPSSNYWGSHPLRVDVACMVAPRAHHPETHSCTGSCTSGSHLCWVPLFLLIGHHCSCEISLSLSHAWFQSIGQEALCVRASLISIDFQDSQGYVERPCLKQKKSIGDQIKAVLSENQEGWDFRELHGSPKPGGHMPELAN